MKLDFRRIAVLLVLVVITFGYLCVRASAEETAPVEKTDPHNMYMTLFSLCHTITGEGDACASIAAYSTDGDTTFRRINLEDAAYCTSGAAGKIRAVILNSYPKKNLVAIQARANSWLRGQGQPEIVDLQSGEATLASQAAIWELSDADHYTIAEKEREYASQNIKSLYNYLCNLDAVGPKYNVVSESSIQSPVYSAVREADGTYTVTISATVNTTVGRGDALTISAACGDDVQTQNLTEAGEYSFRFTGLSDLLEVKLEINGYQSGRDVYLFDAEGGCGGMVGYDDSRFPVHAEILVKPDRILSIFMSTGEEDSKMPLANIQFDIYRVATMEQLESGEVQLSDQPTDEEIAQFQTVNNLIATLTTDAQGFAAYNFTDAGKPDGVYMIAERFNAATQGAVSAFYITIPGTQKKGGYTYTLNMNLENEIETGPMLRENVTKIGNNSVMGKLHTGIIRGDVPAGIGSAQKYVITDIIDYRLDYENGSPVVKLYTKAGTELELEKEKHYTIAEGTVSVEEGITERFSVSLTPAGMAYASANLGEGEYIPEFRVYFKTVINENASLDKEITNTVHLDYTNCAGVEYDADSGSFSERPCSDFD